MRLMVKKCPHWLPIISVLWQLKTEVNHSIDFFGTVFLMIMPFPLSLSESRAVNPKQVALKRSLIQTNLARVILTR